MNPYADRRARLGTGIAAAGAGFGLITAPVSLKYLTGWTNPSTRFAGLLVAPDGEAALVAPALEAEEAARTHLPLFTWKDGTDPFRAVAEAAARLNVSAGVLGVEKDVIPLGTYERAAAALGVRVAQDVGGLVRDLRAHKDAHEVSLMQRAADMLNPALDAAVQAIRPGMTETEVVAVLEEAMRKAGAEGLAFETHVLAGAKSALPHGAPGQVRIQPGDVVLMDFGAMVGGYLSDITRCVSVGTWDEKMGEIYDIVLQAHDAAIAAARPGATYHEIDAAARSVITAAGYGEYFVHRTGHGLGLEVHEEPYVVGGSDRKAEPGHVVTIEPGIYLPGAGGIRIEDDILITESGCRVLTSWTTERLTVG